MKVKKPTQLYTHTHTHTHRAVLKVRKPTRALTALTRLKKQGVEGSLLLPNHFPHCRPWSYKGP